MCLLPVAFPLDVDLVLAVTIQKHLAQVAWDQGLIYIASRPFIRVPLERLGRQLLLSVWRLRGHRLLVLARIGVEALPPVSFEAVVAETSSTIGAFIRGTLTTAFLTDDILLGQG